ncbi:hypothetical protein KY341_05550 [Candidatus Woesearchaeota archaeon]|nr:hypothetical protein [Candidatus Woesearchaeota archaeon]
MNLTHLIGKNILEVITELPEFDWVLKSEVRPLRKAKLKQVMLAYQNNKKIRTELQDLTLVYYESAKPRLHSDTYHRLDVSKGITLDDLSCTQKTDLELSGLISKVMLGKPYPKSMYKHAHIPMVDFDMHDTLDFLNEKEKIELIKEKVKQDTEINQGVILRSGPKKNYHFMGIGELLDEEKFISFIGLALGMHIIRDNKKINLADSRHLGHGLIPMVYMSEIHNSQNPKEEWSRYFCAERFLTLRIQPKKGYKDLPRVVDVIEQE